jgi:lipid-binding SYLF domain-containing protein
MGKVAKQTFIVICMLLSACASTQGSIADRQQAVQEMKTEVLTELYEVKPDVQSQVTQASGYAVFSNANINLIFASFGGGYGVLRNNQSGQDTYMKMGEVGLGFGVGIKDFRIVMVFHTQDALDRFMENGIAFGAQADAAAVADDQGVAFGGEVTVDNITIYQMTKAGLALQATVKGTRFWEDEELN